jgi:hypothetical protein
MQAKPTCFISYSWDNKSHKAWVHDLASRLREAGIDVQLDQWHAVPGDQLPYFMESAVRENDYVLIICTPTYKERADGRVGGVGYEGDIIAGEGLVHRRDRKVIPVLRRGEWQGAAPSFCLGKYYIDLSSDPYSEEKYQDLLSTLLGKREQAPPLGELPPHLLRRASLAEASDNRPLYPIEHGAFPVITDSDAARATLLAIFRDALIETFKNRQIRFTVALYVTSVQSGGAEFPVYQLWSHYKEFVFSASTRHQDFLRQAIEVRLSGGDSERIRERVKRRIAEREEAASQWTVDTDVAFETFPRAHWVTYEPSIKRIQIKVDRKQSADPKEYDAKIKITSEALAYACALGGQPTVFLGDIGWHTDNFNLLKLTCFVIDRRILDFERFRILDSDPETWDFHYPELEAEFRERW